MNSANAELAYRDLNAAKTFWEAAGFEVSDYDSGFAFARRGNVELHLFSSDEGGGSSGAYLHTADVDAEHARWSAADLEPSAVTDEPWGMREFVVRDPGGNRIRVGTAR